MRRGAHGSIGWQGRGLARLAGLLLALLSVLPAEATPRRDRALEAQLMAHITELASDAYEGREPGTEGEARTLRYLGRQWYDMGLVSGTNDPANEWFAPVTVIEREPAQWSARFSRRGRPQHTPADAVVVLTSGKRGLIREAPVLFVGKGQQPLPPRSELAGRVVLLLDAGIEGGERQNALIAAGASAVMTVLDGERTLAQVKSRRIRPGYALAGDALGGDLEAFITREGLSSLLQGSGRTLGMLEAAAGRSIWPPRSRRRPARRRSAPSTSSASCRAAVRAPARCCSWPIGTISGSAASPQPRSASAPGRSTTPAESGR
jgi:hypothetical protein